ncbi:serine/arginine-rich splicing factor SR45a-like [Nymphaea colorata]|nr:serine/arginine-rich splicing factor SR45a-like [Nymphaea colorata]
MAGRSRRSLSSSRSRSRSRSRSYDSSDSENPGNNLYVTGLSTRVTKKELEKHFSSEGGTVVETHLVVDPRTRESRGFGFVTMSTNSEAGRCVKYLNRSVLGGRVITVEKARRKRGRTPTPGRYLGVNTVRVRRRSPSYSPYGRSGYDSGRDRSYSPNSRRGRERYRSTSRSRDSRSPYGSRHRSYSGGSRSPYARRHRSYSRDSRSPYDRDRRERSRSYSPYRKGGRERSRFSYGRRGRSTSYGRHKRSASRSISPRQSSRDHRRSPSRSLSPRSRGRRPSVSSRSRS